MARMVPEPAKRRTLLYDDQDRLVGARVLPGADVSDLPDGTPLYAGEGADLGTPLAGGPSATAPSGQGQGGLLPSPAMYNAQLDVLQTAVNLEDARQKLELREQQAAKRYRALGMEPPDFAASASAPEALQQAGTQVSELAATNPEYMQVFGRIGGIAGATALKARENAIARAEAGLADREGLKGAEDTRRAHERAYTFGKEQLPRQLAEGFQRSGTVTAPAGRIGQAMDARAQEFSPDIVTVTDFEGAPTSVDRRLLSDWYAYDESRRAEREKQRLAVPGIADTLDRGAREREEERRRLAAMPNGGNLLAARGLTFAGGGEFGQGDLPAPGPDIPPQQIQQGYAVAQQQRQQESDEERRRQQALDAEYAAASAQAQQRVAQAREQARAQVEAAGRGLQDRTAGLSATVDQARAEAAQRTEIALRQLTERRAQEQQAVEARLQALVQARADAIAEARRRVEEIERTYEEQARTYTGRLAQIEAQLQGWVARNPYVAATAGRVPRPDVSATTNTSTTTSVRPPPAPLPDFGPGPLGRRAA